MIKLVGMILLVIGAAGYAYVLCTERGRRLKQLKELKYMYQLIQNEILYMRLPLPDIFISVSRNISEPFGSALKEIGENITLQQEEHLEIIWKRRMEKALSRTGFTAVQRDSLLRLPKSIQLGDCEGQAKALQRMIEEMDKMIKPIEEEEKSKNKVIMSLGIAAGLFLSILLL